MSKHETLIQWVKIVIGIIFLGIAFHMIGSLNEIKSQLNQIGIDVFLLKTY